MRREMCLLWKSMNYNLVFYSLIDMDRVALLKINHMVSREFVNKGAE